MVTPLPTTEEIPIPADFVTGTWNPFGSEIGGQGLGDRFGFSIDLSSDGRTVVLGSDSLTVYYFDADNSRDWQLLGQIIPGESDSGFGYSVALSSNGRIMAVGATGGSGGTGTATGSVQVYSYQEDSSQWEQIGSTLLGDAGSDDFGSSVDLSSDGTVLAVGARQGSLSTDVPGYAQVYRFSSSSWIPYGQQLVGDVDNDGFGYDLSLSSDGRTLAVGAWLYDAAGVKDGGLIRVYTYNVATLRWERLGQDLVGATENARFGFTVALSADGQTVATSGGFQQTVSVLVYRPQGWEVLGREIQGSTGDSIALSADGRVLASTSSAASPNGITRAGLAAVYRYDPESLDWLVIDQAIPGTSADNNFGDSVALSADGMTLAVGADGYFKEFGTARVFALQ